MSNENGNNVVGAVSEQEIELETFTASDIEIKPINWLHRPYMPFGSVVLVIGDGGQGKSYYALAVAAALTRGRLVTGEPAPIEPSHVVVHNDENPWPTVIAPRLVELGADMNLVHGIKTDKRRLTLTDPRIEASIVKYKARFVILDPIQNCIPPNLSMNRAESIRPALMNLRQVAERTNSVIMLVGHIGKGRGKAQHKSLGSVDIVNSVPSAICLGKVEGYDKDVRAVCALKSNFAELGVSQHFRLTKTGGFEWLGECDATPEDVMTYGMPKRQAAVNLSGRQADCLNNVAEIIGEQGKVDGKKELARVFLRELLSDGMLRSNEIFEEGERGGLSQKTLERAKDEMKEEIDVRRHDGHWYWELI